MKTLRPTKLRVLAIDPSVRGFGFVVFEGAEHLIDWGAKTVKGDKNAQSLKRVAGLIDYYLPDVIVVEDYQGKGSRRCSRVQRVIDEIIALASAKEIKSKTFSRMAVKKLFSHHGAFTKHEIAVAIAQQFTELYRSLPRLRKSWMIEDNRMNIFDAAALAFTFFHSRGKDKEIHFM